MRPREDVVAEQECQTVQVRLQDTGREHSVTEETGTCYRLMVADEGHPTDVSSGGARTEAASASDGDPN
jgi:hypothetical protein